MNWNVKRTKRGRDWPIFFKKENISFFTIYASMAAAPNTFYTRLWPFLRLHLIFCKNFCKFLCAFGQFFTFVIGQRFKNNLRIWSH